MSDRKRPLENSSGYSDHLNNTSHPPANDALLGNQAVATTYEYNADDVNFIIQNLGTPTDNVPTIVSQQYNNDSIVGNEIQAYAKIAGCNWTYYVKTLAVTIGRNTEPRADGTILEAIDIDLGPSKVVSRKHASIEYDLNGRKWQLFTHGRNGLKVNGIRLNLPPNTPCDLASGNIVDIGGTQMMFILPDAPPVIPEFFRPLLTKKARVGSQSPAKIHGSTSSLDVKSDSNSQVKAFQLQEGISHPDSISSEQDYSKDSAKDMKPPYSYATMITQAILSNPNGILSLAEIYDWISTHFAYYRHTKQGWQNSIRHNLSLNKAFEKVPRKPSEPGKGMKWQISEAYRNEFLQKWKDGSLNKVRRGTSVSRQLQLHLIKNNVLPKGRPSTAQKQDTSSAHSHIHTIDFSDQSQQRNGHARSISVPYNNNNSPNHDNNNSGTSNGNNMTLNLPLPTGLNSTGYAMPHLSPSKSAHNDMSFIHMRSATHSNSNSNLPSPIKGMSIPDINYLNSDPKLSSGLVSGMSNSNNSDQLLNTPGSNLKINIGGNPHGNIPSIKQLSSNNNRNSNNNTETKTDDMGRSNFLPAMKAQFGNNENGTERIPVSPKKFYPKMDLLTPERNVQRPNLEPNSAQSHASVNSSPALWNYVQFSTPLGPGSALQNHNNNGGNAVTQEPDKLPKLDLESPLKNRKTSGKVSDLRDVDPAKGFKQ